jgi:gamma-glutamylcyclotransferase (GGCT)/AIG2-like uncharacterized protein YtfP
MSAGLGRLHVPDDPVVQLFVYGTLMPGHGNFGRIERYVRRARAATVAGGLVDLGAFPALVPEAGIVRGVVLDIEPEGLLIADGIEGFRPDEAPCFYRRQETEIRLDAGGSVKGWVYVFARPHSIADRPRLLVGEQDGVPVYAWSPSGVRDNGSGRPR